MIDTGTNSPSTENAEMFTHPIPRGTYCRYIGQVPVQRVLRRFSARRVSAADILTAFYRRTKAKANGNAQIEKGPTRQTSW